MATDHNLLIAKSAKAVLGPLGCTRKGTSRTWLDDHGWWVGVIEFQPSNFAKGTFLNVGSCWLWSGNDFLSFDDGYRIEPFQAFSDEIQFESVATTVAERAKEEVLKLRERFLTIESASVHLQQKSEVSRDIWAKFHAGVSSGLMGFINDAKNYFELALEADDRDINWVVQLKYRCTELRKLVEDNTSFKSHIEELIARKRSALKLPSPREVCLEL
ncbi:hypothetical protein [Propionivibrio sp.]|uniref:hypothetical protein n=1 Tax=Propionivibrio sp. TaxID=2212460 RepID=UPI0039E2CDD6